MKYLISTFVGIALLLAATAFGQTSWEAPLPGWLPPQAFLGVKSNTISKEKAKKLGFDNPYGSYVTSVIRNTAADKAGILPFDYIYRVDDQEVSDDKRLGDLLTSYKPGDRVKIYLIRKEKKQTLTVTLGTREDADYDTPDDTEKAFFGISQTIGASRKDDPDGVRVNIVRQSTAEEIGLQNGDILTAINGNRILDWEDITTAIGNTQAGASISVQYVRDGQKGVASGKLKSVAESQKEFIFVEKAPPAPEPPTSEAPFIGIYMADLTKEKAAERGYENPYGVYVEGIVPGSAAEKAGLQAFDYIIGIDEYRVGENQSLGGILKKYRPGDQAEIFFYRQGKKQSARITFGSKTDLKEEKAEKNKCQQAFLGISQNLRIGGEKTEGVQVNIVENSTAEALGLQNGDILKSINGQKIVDWSDITIALDNLDPGTTITVEYERNGARKKASGALKSYAETKNCKDCDCDEFDLNIDINLDDLDFDFDFDFDLDEKKRAEDADRPDLSNLGIRIEDLSRADAQSLKESQGMDVRGANDLDLQRLRLKPDLEKGLFRLSFYLPNKGDTMVRIYNNKGRAIYIYEMSSFSGDFEDEVDLAQNGPGLYFLEITQGTQSSSKKIELK